MDQVRKKIAREKQKVQEELRKLKRQGCDVTDIAFRSVREYSDGIKYVEKEVVECMENLVHWAKLELTESRIRYERGKKGLKKGEIYAI